MVEMQSADLKLLTRVDEKLFNEQVNRLYHALDADDIAAANRIIEAIGDSKNTLAIEPLAILLEYWDESIQGSAALALGKIGDKAAIRPLVNALKGTSDKVKISIVTALGMFGDKSVIRAIESIPLTPDEPKLINTVRSTVYKLNHPEGAEKTFQPPDPTRLPPEPQVDLIMLQENRKSSVSVEPAKEKSPILAAIGSFFIPGLGQVYNGEGYAKGFKYLIGMYIGSLLLVIPGLAIWIYGIYNAYRMANKINAGEAVTTDPSLSGIIIYAFLAAIVIPIVIGVLIWVIMLAFVLAMV
jgi:TM2 domain-containing membrane protein YozV